MASPEVGRDKSPFMLQPKSLPSPVSKSSKTSSFKAQIMLRVFAAAFTLAAICVMTTSSQSFTLLGFTIKAHYSDSSAMRFLLVTDAIVCAFSVLSVLFVYRLSRSGSDMKYCFYLFLHDMVSKLLVLKLVYQILTLTALIAGDYGAGDIRMLGGDGGGIYREIWRRKNGVDSCV
ncbi:hypothetical protein Goarm_013839 [Gossypium armourianum]|uniref:CASP-like protein n=1 Tax=Gossypium armourianum TaxID=34283 RepID=A0A7J9J495_9ROSI|nr:hypothetical protein [Gossypium armourianum]